MSKSSGMIPPKDQDIDPNKERPEGAVNRTERNPEGRMQADYVGTPQVSEQELADRKLIAEQNEIRFRTEPLIREVTDKVRNSYLRVQYIEAIEAAIAGVEEAAAA